MRWMVCARASVMQVLLASLLVGVFSTTSGDLHHQTAGATMHARNKELLYSRQTFTHGKAAQQRLSSGSVTVVGSGESFRSFLCKDTMKHLALSGVSRLRLCPLAVAQLEAQKTSGTPNSLLSQPAMEEDTMQSIDAVANMAKDLNSDVHVEICSEPRGVKSDVMLAINVPIETQLQLNDYCRKHGIRYTSCATTGLAGYIFNDFGDEVDVRDDSGKLLVTQRHRSLRAALSMPRLSAFDSSAEPRRHLKLQSALFGYFMQRRSDTALPLIRRQLAEDVRATLSSLVAEHQNTMLADDAAINAVYDCISEPLHAANVATSAVVAAIAAQQCITALTQVFAPVDQLMPLAFPEASTATGANGPLEAAERLARLRVLLVGAGAIGCELLKNLGAMNTCTTAQGAVFVTDYDTVSLSNLSRQLLFRTRDVGAMKASTAAAAMKQLAPRMRVKPMHTKIAKHMDRPLPDAFWQDMDVVLTGVDNVDARRDVDEYCVRYGLPLVDSGTLGAQASTQVVIPDQTESYSASSDPADTSIPVCTIKTFPTTTEHTILWGKEIFKDLFSAQPMLLRKAFGAVAQAAAANSGDAGHGRHSTEQLAQALDIDVATAQTLFGQLQLLFALHKDARTAVQLCLRQQIQLFEQCFYLDLDHLLQQHPPGSLDEDGGPYWGDGRRQPQPVHFDFANETHRNFVQTASFLRLTALGATGDGSTDAVDRLWKAVSMEYERLAATRTLYQPALYIPPAFNFSQCVVLPLEFDKDDFERKHVDFVHAAATLRAAAFGLPPPEDTLLVRKVAGNIIPALSTTTGLAAGLVALELVKLAARKPVAAFRNSYSNLATGNIAFTETVGAEQFTIAATGETFSQWSQVEAPLPAPLLKIGKLVQFVEQRFGVQVSAITHEDQMLFAEFLPNSEELKGKTISQALSDVESGWDAEEQFELGRDFVDLHVTAEHDGAEQLLPRIRVSLARTENVIDFVVSWGKSFLGRFQGA